MNPTDDLTPQSTTAAAGSGSPLPNLPLPQTLMFATFLDMLGRYCLAGAEELRRVAGHNDDGDADPAEVFRRLRLLLNDLDGAHNRAADELDLACPDLETNFSPSGREEDED